MKKIITTAIMAMLLSVGIASAQTKNNDVIYVINLQVVEPGSFDGSQLQNKTIASYQVDSELGLHVIFTSDYTKDKKIYQTKVVAKGDGVSVVSYDSKGNTMGSAKVVSHPETIYVVDGKITPANEFLTIFPSQIESMTIVKSKDNPDFQKYAKANTEVVMMITTKK